jgi:hypothetical protein
MFASKRAAARWSVRAVITALAAGALVLPAVAVAQPLATAGPAVVAPSATAQAAQVRQEVNTGTLLRNHGVVRTCVTCLSEVVTVAPGSSKPLVTALPAGKGPADLAAAYHLPATSTSTNTIAIIDAGVDPNLASDLATYRSTYGLPACTTASGCLKLENFNGGAQPAPQRAGTVGSEDEEEIAVETSLDMDMASAACSSCHLLEVSVPFQAGVSDSNTSTGEFAQAVATAAAAGAKAISISYGYTETTTNTSGTDLADFNKPGVAITVSTGDAGFNGGTHQDWPSDLPTVIAVGGTTLGATTETAWSDGGSGCETRFTGATGQPAAVTALCASHRAAADVSSDADPNSGVAVFDTYAPFTGEPDDFIVVGGTSASAPFIGGLFARAGVPATLNGPNTLYSAASTNFRDITSGSNQASKRCSSFQ